MTMSLNNSEVEEDITSFLHIQRFKNLESVKTVKLKPESLEMYFALWASQSVTTTTRLNLARVKPELHK